MKWKVVIALLVGLIVAGNGPVLGQGPENFDTSLHKTRAGKAYWYSEAQGGFESLTGVPIDSLGCMKCHPATYADGSQVDAATYEPGCKDCHDFAQGTQVADAQCLQCHGRQKTEIVKMNLSDVHRDAGMGCTDCHTKKEMHGDGQTYHSMLESGAMEVTCEMCHQDPPSNPSHAIHSDDLECNTCHAQTVISCYNCHFESEVKGKVKRAWGGLKGFMLLTRRQSSGKIAPSTFMAMTYQGKSFYAIAPFSSHSITRKGKQCNECHGTEAVQRLMSGTKIKLTTWDEANGKILPYQGVIPVPENWGEAFEFDFLTYNGDPAGATDPSLWAYLKSETDLTQMLFASPLTAEEILKLAQPQVNNFPTSLHGTRQGKAYFYGKNQGGFETLTNVPIDSLGCLKCHPSTYADGTPVDLATYEPSCLDCHDFSKGYEVADEQCLQCHGRQKTEIMKMKLEDVHRTLGMGCTDCHTQKEMHGDGHSYNSLNQAGAMEVSCEKCHANPPDNPAHTLHTDDVDCAACHTKTVISCYNCHLESILEGHVKRAWGGVKGFMLLGRRERTGKIAPASFMTATYNGKSFFVVAPFFSHNVTKDPRPCKDCHGTAMVDSLLAGKPVQMTRWDEANKKIIAAQGVIPIVNNWSQLFRFDFLTYNGDPAAATDPSQWTLLKKEADLSQMLFVQPLTGEELDKLSMAQAGTFATSLHATREGKAYYYSKEQGGFEALTGISIDSLGCLKCHPATYADGSPVDAATYEPSCLDCHDFSKGYAVPDDQCLQCHGRQKVEIKKMNLPDVHRDRGMSCTDCHTSKEMHGDGTAYHSMNQPGAMEVSCEKCHTSITSSVAHDTHKDQVECAACHTKTVISCYNCHFESLLQGHVKRPWGGLKGFMFLGRRARTGKVAPATFMSMSYNGKAFYTVAPYFAHTVVKEGRGCSECHGNDAIQALASGKAIQVAEWDETNKKVVPYQGVIPLSENWRKVLKFDFLTYTGDPASGTTDPTKWQLLKSQPDSTQMLFVEPLTVDELKKLGYEVGVKERSVLPGDYLLTQNYPNPFNPSTTIELHLPKATRVTLKVYNMKGEVVATLVDRQELPAGVHKFKFGGENLPSGVYLYRVETPGYTRTYKMMLLK
jgi:hypothetical protein